MTGTPATEPGADQHTTRSAFVGAWVDASIERSPVDRKCMTNQITAWSVDLAAQGWVAQRYGWAAASCAGAPPAAPMTGWQRVADLYDDYADPLARYVVSYYYETWATRPRRVPHRLRDSLREKARSAACTAVHRRLVHGADHEPGILRDEPAARTFVADTMADTVEHRAAHWRSAALAFADGVLELAEGLDSDHSAVARRLGLPFDAVESVIALLTQAAGELIASLGDGLPSEREAGERADALLEFVTAEHQRTAASIRTHTLAGTTPPESLTRRSQYIEDARERTRHALVRAIRHGRATGEDDARRMFFARLRWLTIKNGTDKPAARMDEHTVRGAGAPVAASTAYEELLGRLREQLVEHRAEIPLGLGAAAEYDLALAVLGSPGLEAELLLSDPDALTRWCARAWASGCPDRAIAADPAAAADLVLHAVRWAAEQSGYRP